MKKLFILAIIISLLIPAALRAQEKKNAQEPKFEMVQYYFVNLIKGPNRTQPDSTAKKIQAGHMANMEKMAADGKLICAGPYADDKGGGIFIISVKTIEEARALVDNDPAVKAGRLTYEIRPWMTAKGTFKNEK